MCGAQCTQSGSCLETKTALQTRTFHDWASLVPGTIVLYRVGKFPNLRLAQESISFETTNVSRFLAALFKQHQRHLESLGRASQFRNAMPFHTMPRQSGSLGKQASMRAPHMRDCTSHTAKSRTVHPTSNPGQYSNRCVFYAHIRHLSYTTTTIGSC